MLRSLWVAFFMAATLAACAQVRADDAQIRADADAAYAAQEWLRAQSLFTAVLKKAPADGRAWYRLAVALRHNGSALDALGALDNAAQNGVPAQFTEIERARALAQLGRLQDSIEALRKAVQAGFSNPDMLSGDPDFEVLQESEGIEALIRQAQENRTPCATRAPFRQFDFWVGEWVVHDASNNEAGTNVIRQVEGGCYLLEQWRGAGGTTGSSMNYYDAARDKWVQHWVSQGGTQIQIEGGLVDGAMVMTGKIYYLTSGQQADFKGSWTPLEDGRVRQFFEQSVDGGLTWTNWFEGFYTRKKLTPDGEAHGGG